MAKLKMLEVKIVGSHGGADRFSKLRESAHRVYELSEVVKNFEPKVAVNFSSPEGARVAFGLGIDFVGVNDSPHAEAVARLTVPLMSILLTPWIIPYAMWIPFGIDRKRIVRYRALDPAAWLKIASEKQMTESSRKISTNNHKIGKKVLVRLEESKAAYIADRKLGLDVALLDTLVSRLAGTARVIILCRYADQIEQMKSRFRNTAEVLDDVKDGTELIRTVDVFVGAGGTMTTEAALLGKPAISIAPHRFEVEDYLEKIGLVNHPRSSDELVQTVTSFLFSDRRRHAQQKKAKKVLDAMEDPTQSLLNSIMSFDSR